MLRNTQREEIRAQMAQALKDNDPEAYSAAFDQMADAIAQSVRSDMEKYMEEQTAEKDNQVLASRGVRQLTSEERSYYQSLLEAMRSDRPAQAISNLDKAMPTTVIASVFEELRTDHPLLSRINFEYVPYGMRVLLDGSAQDEATWGDLCDAISKEISPAFEVIDATEQKLTAFVYACKPGLEVGPEWIDRYVRECLYEAYANGMEKAIVDGTGKKQPIGMSRQVGAGVVVTDGVYPRKEATVLSAITPATIGNLISQIAVKPSGKKRTVDGVIFIVNPADYFNKIMPATTILNADGTYRRDVMPYPMDIIQSAYVPEGYAIIGMANRYFAAAGVANGRIEYSDEFKFLDDVRTYVVRGYANGRPKDNAAFMYLNISGVAAYRQEVVSVDARTPSSNDDLAFFDLSGITLNTPFVKGTTFYTATASTGATTIVTAIPGEAEQTLLIKQGSTAKQNHSTLTLAAGSNVITCKVTAADGSTNQTYTITVTAS